MAHSVNFRMVEKATDTTIKTAKAYSSNWDNNVRFKDKNVTKVVEEELKKAKFEYFVLAAPTVDITNIDVSNVKPDDPTDAFKRRVETSCKNMMNVAERALKNDASLKEVILMNHVPRLDTKQEDPVGIKTKLATYANNLLQEKWLESSQKDKIHVASHDLTCVPDKQALTQSVKNILISSVKQPSQPDQRRPILKSHENMSDSFHTRCPQAKYAQQQARRLYSEVVYGTPIHTQNRVSPLSKNF